MTKPKRPHVHDWYLRESRPLHGVEPPTTLKTWYCWGCKATKDTEHPRTT